ncbi:MAG: ASCH domain-containing protein [Chlamydiales bacterium]|nr:ASCH domain-containing protein [Chlamydiia bacterium]MCP5508271.1 ASCH domain-containing protein [Chlamydiales bacterium]
MVLQLHCQEPWFSYIKEGKKIVEGRKYTEKIRKLHPGDKIEFFNGSDRFITEVVAIRVYPSIEEYLRKECVDNVLPGINEMDEGLRIYRQWSNDAEVDAWGFAAIQVALIAR